MYLQNQIQCTDKGALSLTAPAKVNIFLHIVGQGGDGYHLLQSLFVFTKSGDKITISPNQYKSDVRLLVSGNQANGLSNTDNLVLDAASALKHYVKQPDLSANLKLEKNLLVASGIGGGSSDAASTLLLLNRFWNLQLSMQELEILALGIGADVPACLYARPLFVEGVGEKLTHVDIGLPPYIVLVNPCIGVSTAKVFQIYQKSLGDEQGYETPLASFDTIKSDMSTYTTNSLFSPAQKLVPLIGECIDVLQACKGVGLVRMSGSGATCFGLFDTDNEARAAAANIAAKRTDWWVWTDQLRL